jgi:hypothetical protein
MCLNRLGKLEIPIIPALPGTPGLNGDDANVWLSGPGEPTSQLGNLKDYYLDTVTNLVWNKTSNVNWSQIADLTGSEGPEGPVSTAPSTVPGPAGENSFYRLYSNVVPTSLASPLNTTVTIDSYTLPANTLVNDGDAIIINLYINKTSLNTNYCDRTVTIGGNIMTRIAFINPNPYMAQTSLFNGVYYTYKLTVEFIKTSATTAISRCYADLNSPAYGTTPLYINYKGVDGFVTPVFDFTQPIPILMQISQSVANGVTFQSATIDKITKI